MDKLDVIKLAEEYGGQPRRAAMEHLVIKARNLGASSEVGGGQVGGMNIRYGSIGYAVMDVNTEGVVKLYVQPHPNKEAPEEHVEALNRFIDEREELEPKSFPISSYGHLEAKIEDIPTEIIDDYLEKAVELIRQTYYSQHI